MKTEEAVFYYASHPYEFVVDIIGAAPSDEQKQILDKIPQAIINRLGIATKSGHGVGKTALESWIVIWFMSTRPFPKVIVTAPTQHQLYDVFWSELAKWHKKSKVIDMFEWMKTSFHNKKHKEQWFAVARTANKPENMQGFHGEHLLFIVDEASGVASAILEAIEGSQTQPGSLAAYFGNPTQISGGFYDAFHSKRKFFETFTISTLECSKKRPDIADPRYAEKIASKYGEDSDIYRVRVLGEFPKAEPDTLISLDKVEKAAMREKVYPVAYEHVELGVDVARYGDDEITIYKRIGNVIEEEAIMRHQDLMATVGAIMQIAHKYKEKHVIINIDDSGLGGGVTDRLKEVVKEEDSRISVNAVNNGAKAKDVDFINMGSEMWFFMKEKIKELSIPNDSDLIAQLSTRRFGVSSAGKNVIETKEHMKQRGLTSPDRADGAILTLYSLIYGMKGNKNLWYAC